MRHGRKSKSKRFNGYKQHLAADLDTTIILAAVVTAANRAEAAGAQPLAGDMARMGVNVGELYIDRAYINAPIVADVLERRGDVFCELRRRTGVEHRLAHLAHRQGPHARYRGIRKNTFDLRRAAVVQNFETTQRTSALGGKAA